MGVKGLGKTGESYVELWAKEQIYNRRKEFSNKYTQKGLIMEDESIDLACKNLLYFEMIKNEQYFENDFICGTPDVILENEVIDIKTSWDFSTFPLFDKNIPNIDYYYQLHGYMMLTGKESAKLIYCLVDTPIHIIEKEAKRMVYDFGYDYNEIYAELLNKSTYDNISIEKRVKVFEFKKDAEICLKIENRVIECRNYLKTLI